MRSRGCLQCFISTSLSSAHSSSAPVWGVSHGMQPFKNFSNRSPSHKLHFFNNCSSMDSLPWVMVHQEQTDPVWATLGLHFLPENLLQWGCLLRRTSTFSGMGFSIGISVDTPLQSSVGSWGKFDPLWLQRNFCSGAWNTSSFFFHLGVCKDASHVFFFILHTAVQHFGFS